MERYFRKSQKFKFQPRISNGRAVDISGVQYVFIYDLESGGNKDPSGHLLRLREADYKSLDCATNVFEAFECLAITLYSFEEHIEGSNPETVFAI